MNTQTHEDDKYIDLPIAIDFCSSMFIFLNLEHEVSYVNFKALQFLAKNENNLKLYDEEFNPHVVMGQQIAYLRSIIQEHNSIQELQLGQEETIIESMGDIYVKIKVSPIFNRVYQKIGFCLEISDITDLIQAQQLFKKVIELGKTGDFSNQIDTSLMNQNNSLFKEVFEDVNVLFSTVDNFFHDVVVGLENLSSGNLNYSIPVKHDEIQTNTFEAVKNDLNYTADKLRSLILNVHEISMTMNTMIFQLMQTNSEVAMTVEKEFVDASQNKNDLDEQIEILKNNSGKIEQATSIIDLEKGKSDQLDCITGLQLTVNSMGKQILDISVVAQSMEYFFNIHLTGLKNGLAEINKGSLGKGVNIIQNSVNEIISKSTDAMRQIRTSLDDLGTNFNQSNESINLLLGHISKDMVDMEETIGCLSETLKLIQTLIHQQDQTFNRFAGLTSKLDELHHNTMHSIESMIIATSELVNFSNVLDNSINSFKFAQIENDVVDLCADLHGEDVENSDCVMLFWN